MIHSANPLSAGNEDLRLIDVETRVKMMITTTKTVAWPWESTRLNHQ